MATSQRKSCPLMNLRWCPCTEQPKIIEESQHCVRQRQGATPTTRLIIFEATMGDEYYSIHPPEVVQMLHNLPPPSPLSSAPNTPINDHQHSKNAFSDADLDDAGIVNPPRVSRKLLPPSTRNPAYSRLPAHLTSPTPVMPPVGLERSTKKKKTFMKKTDAPFDENPLSVPPLECSATERTLRILKGETGKHSSRRNFYSYDDTPDDEHSHSKSTRRNDMGKTKNRSATKAASKSVNFVEEAPDDERMSAFSMRNILAEMDDMEETVSVAKRNILVEMDELEDKIFDSRSYQSPKTSSKVTKANSTNKKVEFRTETDLSPISSLSKKPLPIADIDDDPIDEHDELMVPKSPSPTRDEIMRRSSEDNDTVAASSNADSVVSEPRDGDGLMTSAELDGSVEVAPLFDNARTSNEELTENSGESASPVNPSTRPEERADGATAPLAVRSVDSLLEPLTLACMSLGGSSSPSTSPKKGQTEMDTNIGKIQDVVSKDLVISNKLKSEVTFGSMLRDAAYFSTAAASSLAAAGMASVEAAGEAVEHMVLGPPEMTDDKGTITSASKSPKRVYVTSPYSGLSDAAFSMHFNEDDDKTDVVTNLTNDKNQERERNSVSANALALSLDSVQEELPPPPPPTPPRDGTLSPSGGATGWWLERELKRKEREEKVKAISKAHREELSRSESVPSSPAPSPSKSEVLRIVPASPFKAASSSSPEKRKLNYCVNRIVPVFVPDGRGVSRAESQGENAVVDAAVAGDDEVTKSEGFSNDHDIVSGSAGLEEKTVDGDRIVLNTDRPSSRSPDSDVEEEKKEEDNEPAISCVESNGDSPTRDSVTGSARIGDKYVKDELLTIDRAAGQKTESNPAVFESKSCDGGGTGKDGGEDASDLYNEPIEQENLKTRYMQDEVDLLVSSSSEEVFEDQVCENSSFLNVDSVGHGNKETHDANLCFSSSEEESEVKESERVVDIDAKSPNLVSVARDISQEEKPHGAHQVAMAREEEPMMIGSALATDVHSTAIEQESNYMNHVAKGTGITQLSLSTKESESGQDEQTSLNPVTGGTTDAAQLVPTGVDYSDSVDHDAVCVIDEVQVASSGSGEESGKTACPSEAMSIASLGTEILSNKAPLLIGSLDNVVGICQGDVLLSLVHAKDANASSASADGGVQIHNAVWRMRIMRRCFTLRETGELSGNPASYGVFGKGSCPFPARSRSSLPVDVDNMRVVGALEQTRALEASAIDHLRHDEFDDALELYEDILYSYKETFKRRNWNQNAAEDGNFCVQPYIGNVLHNKGIVNFLKQDFTEALLCFEMALESRKSRDGSPNPDELTTLVKIALCRFALGHFSKAHAALELCLEAAKGQIKTFMDFSLIAEIMNNLGCLAFMGGDPKAAMDMFVETLKVQQSVMSHSLYSGSVLAGHSTHLSISIVRANIAFLRLCAKDYAGAIVFFERALVSQQLLLYDSHETLLGTMDHLAAANQLGGHNEKAINMLERMLRALTQVHGADDPRCEILRLKIGVVQSSTENGKVEQAKEEPKGQAKEHEKGQATEDRVKDIPSEGKATKTPPGLLRKFTLRKGSGRMKT